MNEILGTRPAEDVFAEMIAEDPELAAEIEARQATSFRVHVANAISQRPDARFTSEFDNLDEAREFAQAHWNYYNNTRVTLTYLAGTWETFRLAPGGNFTGQTESVELPLYKTVPVW